MMNEDSHPMIGKMSSKMSMFIIEKANEIETQVIRVFKDNGVDTCHAGEIKDLVHKILKLKHPDRYNDIKKPVMLNSTC